MFVIIHMGSVLSENVMGCCNHFETDCAAKANIIQTNKSYTFETRDLALVADAPLKTHGGILVGLACVLLWR